MNNIRNGSNVAAADSAALGTAALLIGKTFPAYSAAATRQARYLLDIASRWENGAISHKGTQKELWSDNVFMTPPFLAYYAVASDDLAIMKEALMQPVLYGQVLAIPKEGNASTAGLWMHVFNQYRGDHGLWSTGNAWAAMGILRVIATAKHSRWASSLMSEMSTLKTMVKDVLDATIRFDKAEPNEPLVRNYINVTAYYGELAGTTLLAAAAYRAAELDSQMFGKEYVDWADEKKAIVEARINPDTGLLAPVVNPYKWNDKIPATQSPEAQCFAMMMYAAERSLKGAGKMKN
ncbi:hypothetical protein FKW77_004091 [Venturia effusa]|uniref:GH15-like domain-containing protein n=1 Tax=Venturia effusa TaxID=50376 RepID=A0A517LAU1_9PEZI|nr:hypothetical protein FKW77_004091 [Venturia effusa]